MAAPIVWGLVGISGGRLVLAVLLGLVAWKAMVPKLNTWVDTVSKLLALKNLDKLPRWVLVGGDRNAGTGRWIASTSVNLPNSVLPGW